MVSLRLVVEMLGLPQFGQGFAEKNLRRMIQLAEVFPDQEIVVTLSRQLGWSDTDREIRARFDRQASATKQRPLPWSLPILMRKTVFFFVSFHRRAMQAWVLFLVSIEEPPCRTYHFRHWLSDMSQLGRLPVGSLRALAVARVGVSDRRMRGLGRPVPGTEAHRAGQRRSAVSWRDLQPVRRFLR